MRNARILLAALVAAAICAGVAVASATPIGPLPKGPTTAVTVEAAHSFTVRLPQPKVAGRVWRVARAYDGKVVQEIKEGETSKDVWLTYKGVKRGKTRIVFALTRGETSHAYAARTFAISVS